MPVLINFKICDNAKECNGIAVCPTGALSWDDEEKIIKIDNEKCINCRKCEEACMVDAIYVAKNEKEHQKMQKEIDADPRKRVDLFVDRYGAEPIHPAFLISDNKFQLEVLESDKLVAVECFDENSIMCLLKSIPIKELLSGYSLKFRKLEIRKELIGKLKIKKLPALLFFQGGKCLGKVEGYFENKQKGVLAKKVEAILGKKKQEK